MAKYDPLRIFLAIQRGPIITLDFDEIAEMVGGLPPSAYQYSAWWANDDPHVQAASWGDAGWIAHEVDLNRRRVRFRIDSDRSQPEDRRVPEALRDILNGSSGGAPIGSLDRGSPNWIVGWSDQAVMVETEASRRKASGAQAVPMAWIVETYETLQRKRSLSRGDLGTQASHRSAFIFALLAQLPGISHSTQPIRLIVDES